MDSHTSTSWLYVPRFIVADMNLQNTVLSVWRMAVGDSNCQKLQNALLAVSNFFIQQAKLKQSSYTRNLLNAKRGLASLQILQEKQPHSQYIHSELQNAMMLISSLQQNVLNYFSSICNKMVCKRRHHVKKKSDILWLREIKFRLCSWKDLTTLLQRIEMKWGIL